MERRKGGYNGSLKAFYRIRKVGPGHKLSHWSWKDVVMRSLGILRHS